MTKTTFSTTITVLFIINDGFNLLRPFDLKPTFKNDEIWNQSITFSTLKSYNTSTILGIYIFDPGLFLIGFFLLSSFLFIYLFHMACNCIDFGSASNIIWLK